MGFKISNTSRKPTFGEKRSHVIHRNQFLSLLGERNPPGILRRRKPSLSEIHGEEEIPRTTNAALQQTVFKTTMLFWELSNFLKCVIYQEAIKGHSGRFGGRCPLGKEFPIPSIPLAVINTHRCSQMLHKTCQKTLSEIIVSFISYFIQQTFISLCYRPVINHGYTCIHMRDGFFIGFLISNTLIMMENNTSLTCFFFQ